MQNSFECFVFEVVYTNIPVVEMEENVPDTTQSPVGSADREQMDIKALCELLLKYDETVQKWKKESMELEESFREVYDEGMQSTMEWWKTHTEDERKAVLFMVMSMVVEANSTIDPSLLLLDIFPEMDYMTEHTDMVMDFIQNVNKNSYYCVHGKFDVTNLQELMESEVSEMDALYCVSALTEARRNIVLLVCMNIIITCNSLDDE